MPNIEMMLHRFYTRFKCKRHSSSMLLLYFEEPDQPFIISWQADGCLFCWKAIRPSFKLRTCCFGAVFQQAIFKLTPKVYPAIRTNILFESRAFRCDDDALAAYPGLTTRHRLAKDTFFFI